LKARGGFLHNRSVNCPACGEALAAGAERCAACGALVAAATEGSLAPEPTSFTPPGKARGERIVEIPALRRREPTWKDEVRERVQHRRTRRHDGAPLPLFDPDPADAQAEGEDEPHETSAAAAPPLASQGDVLDLPLRPIEPRGFVVPEPTPAKPIDTFEIGPADEPDGPDLEPLEPPVPLERPASLAERLEAGAIDLLILCSSWMAVVYFASRAARVPWPALLPAWPYLAGFLAFLGLLYATVFTGLTGQTPGKILLGLRVVDRAGGRPGPARAALRAALGLLGIAALGLGVIAMFLDPARRALHDRVLKTRVVRA